MDTLSVILLESGLLDRETLAHAMARARSSGIPLQVYLVRQGLITELDLVAALRKAILVADAPQEELKAPQPQALAAVPWDLAESFHLVPLKIDDQGHLVVAMSNPTDTHAIDELAYSSGLYISRVVAPVSAVEAALEKWYRRANEPGGDPVGSNQPAPITRDVPVEEGVVLLTKVKRRPDAPPVQASIEPTDVVPLTRIKRRAAAKAEAPAPAVVPPPSRQQPPVAPPISAPAPKKPATVPGIPIRPGSGRGAVPSKTNGVRGARRSERKLPPSSVSQTLKMLPQQPPAAQAGAQSPSAPSQRHESGSGGSWSAPKDIEADAAVDTGRAKRSTLLGLATKGVERRKRERTAWQAPGALRSVAFDALKKHLDTCTTADSVGQALCDYLSHWFEKVLFLAVKGSSLEGRLGIGLPGEVSARDIRLSMENTSTVGKVVAARTPFQGILPKHGTDGDLLGFLRAHGPILLVPVLVRSRVVALLCGAFPKRPVMERELGDAMVLAESAYERILLAKRRSESPS